MSKVFKSFMSMVITALLLASLALVASAAPPPGYVSKDATIDFECDAVAKLGPVPILPLNFDIVIDIEGYVPASLDPNEVYELLNSSATVTVPGNVISILDGVLGWNNVSGTVMEIHIIISCAMCSFFIF